MIDSPSRLQRPASAIPRTLPRTSSGEGEMNGSSAFASNAFSGKGERASQPKAARRPRAVATEEASLTYESMASSITIAEEFESLEPVSSAIFLDNVPSPEFRYCTAKVRSKEGL